jgi:hypothetical protein
MFCAVMPVRVFNPREDTPPRVAPTTRRRDEVCDDDVTRKSKGEIACKSINFHNPHKSFCISLAMIYCEGLVYRFPLVFSSWSIKAHNMN